jgi:PKD repeat protein
MDFGDGKTQKVEGSLPAKVSHTYGAPGNYELRATAERPCQGDIRMKVDVRR